MIHRHLDIAEDTPVDRLSPAALDDLLDRGALDDWAPLAQAIAADPWGKLAEEVLHLCNAHHMYGTSRLWTAWIKRLRGGTRARVEVGLAELRRSRGVTQTQLGERLGISQSDVSKLERRSDVRLSTLAGLVEALGGSTRVTAVFPEGETDLELPAVTGAASSDRDGRRRRRPPVVGQN